MIHINLLSETDRGRWVIYSALSLHSGIEGLANQARLHTGRSGGEIQSFARDNCQLGDRGNANPGYGRTNVQRLGDALENAR
jgi:hypothetical protein